MNTETEFPLTEEMIAASLLGLRDLSLRRPEKDCPHSVAVVAPLQRVIEEMVHLHLEGKTPLFIQGRYFHYQTAEMWHIGHEALDVPGNLEVVFIAPAHSSLDENLATFCHVYPEAIVRNFFCLEHEKERLICRRATIAEKLGLEKQCDVIGSLSRIAKKTIVLGSTSNPITE